MQMVDQKSFFKVPEKFSVKPVLSILNMLQRMRLVLLNFYTILANVYVKYPPRRILITYMKPKAPFNFPTEFTFAK